MTRFIRHFTHWQGRGEGDYWAVYEVTAKLPAGREPWTVDNRRIGLFMNEQEAIYYMTEGGMR